jgi:hypothetical protein
MTETRQIDGYRRKWSEHGRARVEVECPFCKTVFEAYLWSLAGSGKRCPGCKAKMDSAGSFTK